MGRIEPIDFGVHAHFINKDGKRVNNSLFHELYRQFHPEMRELQNLSYPKYRERHCLMNRVRNKNERNDNISIHRLHDKLEHRAIRNGVPSSKFRKENWASGLVWVLRQVNGRFIGVKKI